MSLRPYCPRWPQRSRRHGRPFSKGDTRCEGNIHQVSRVLCVPPGAILTVATLWSLVSRCGGEEIYHL